MRYIVLLVSFFVITTDGFGQCAAGESQVIIDIDGTTASYTDEISWKLFNADTEDLLASIAPGSVETGAFVSDTLCLTDGVNYRFEAYDSYGDGWSGATYTIRYAGGFPIGTGMPNRGISSSNGQTLEDLFSFVGGSEPGNECSDPISITLDKVFSINTSFYTNDYSTGDLAGSGNETIFEFTPAITDNYIINISSLDAMKGALVQLYNQCLDTAPTLLASDNTGGTKTEISVTYSLIQGQTYYIVVSNDLLNTGYNSIEGELIVGYENVGLLYNSSCNTALPLVLDGDSIYSRPSGNPPMQNPIFEMVNPDQPDTSYVCYGDELYYTFNLASQQDVFIEIGEFPLSEPVYIALQQQDDCLITGGSIYKRASEQVMQKGFFFNDLPVGKYKLIVYLREYLPVDFMFHVSVKSSLTTNTLSNDNCASAISLDVFDYTSDPTVNPIATIPFFKATDSGIGEPCSPNSTFPLGTSDAWVKAVVPTSGNLVVETFGDQYDHSDMFKAIESRFSVYTGSCGSLTEFYCSADVRSHAIDTIQGLPAGEEVFVRLWDKDGDNSGLMGVRFVKPEPVPTSTHGYTIFTDSLHLSFSDANTDYEYTFNIMVSDDNFNTYLPGYGPATVSSSIDSVRIGGLSPATTYFVKYWSSKDKLDNSDTTVFEVETDPTVISSIRSGNWSDPSTWSGGNVPASDSAVYIRHQVLINQGESFAIKDVRIEAGIVSEPLVGLWISSGSLEVAKNIRATIASSGTTDSAGVFITADTTYSASLDVGQDIILEIDDPSIVAQMQFSAINSGDPFAGDSIKINVGDDFLYSNYQSSSSMGNNANIDLKYVHFNVGRRIYIQHNNSQTNQNLKAVFDNSTITTNSFQLEVPNYSAQTAQVNFTNSTTIEVSDAFWRQGNGGFIKFADQSLLSFTGAGNNTIVGFEATQDSIIYNDIVVDLSADLQIDDSVPYLNFYTYNYGTDSEVLIEGELQLINGYINNSDYNVEKEVVFGANASVSGVSSTNFIMGPVVKIGDTAFTFPVGNESGAKPLRFIPADPFQLTDLVRVAPISNFCDTEVLQSAPANTRYRTQEYWEITGVFSNSVSAYFEPVILNTTSEGITNFNTLEFVNFSSGSSLGNDGNTTSESFRTLTTYDFTSFDPKFGLATNVISDNPFHYKKEILSLSMDAAAPGENITLTYSGPFASATDQIYFGGKVANTVSNTANSLTVTVPEGARSGHIELLYEEGKIYNGKENFTIKYDTTKTILASNYSVLTRLDSIKGGVTFDKTNMQLGQITNDDFFDAMIISEGYEDISIVSNLSGAISSHELKIYGDEGNILMPRNLKLALTAANGVYRWDAFIAVDLYQNVGYVYLGNDGTGNFSTKIIGSYSESPVLTDDFLVIDYDYDGITDPIFSNFTPDYGQSFSAFVGDISFRDCSPNGIAGIELFEPDNGRFNQILSGNYINNGNRDVAYLTDGKSNIGMFDLYDELSHFYSGSPRSADQIVEIVNISLLNNGFDQIAASNQVTNEIEIYRFNNGMNTIDVSTISLNFKPGKMVVEDIDGDGFQDLLVSDQNTASIHLLLNNGSGGLTVRASFSYPGAIIADFDVLDLNNDGIKDILILQEGGVMSVAYYKVSTIIEKPQPVASNITSNRFKLDWPAVDSVDQYKVYVGTNNNPNSTGQWDSTFTVPTGPITYTVPEYSEEYFYFVRAINSQSGQKSAYSNQKSVKLPVASYLAQDSLALVAFYNSTAGSSWTDNQNWLSGKMNTWSGLMMDSDSLLSIDLASNNLIGEVPSELTGLNFVSSIDFSNNALSDVSSLVGLASQLNYLNLNNNELSFEQLEGFGAIPNFSYANQNYSYELPIEYFIDLGDEVVLSVAAPASANDFQWYKDSVLIAGATDSSLVLSNIQMSDEGTYYVVVTNSVLTSLTLKSNATNVKVSSLERDIAALRQFYEETNGASWSPVTWDISSDDLSNWSSGNTGIVLENDRVVGINLPENNLSGEVSQILTEIGGLKSVNLSGNAIEDLGDLTSLSNLNSLDMSQNALGYDDIERNISIANFEFSNQANFGNENNQNILQGESYTLAYPIDGTSNTYQWLLNEKEISGANSNSITIDSIEYQDMGDYTLVVKNDIVNAVNPEFELKSNVVNIVASAPFTGKVEDANQIAMKNGRVYLFKYREGQAYDSVRFDNGKFYVAIEAEGIFNLNNIELGDYILYVENDKAEYPNLINTYYPNTIDWEVADLIELRSSLQGVNVIMTKMPSELTGTSKYSGYVENVFDERERAAARRRVSAAGVSARRLTGSSREVNFKSVLANDELVAYVETNDNGEFVIPNLPAGRYIVKCDVPGIPMDASSDIIFELTGEDQESLEVSLIWEGGTISVNNVRYTANKSMLEKALSVYPNPSTGVFTVSGADGISSIKVLSTEGRLLEEMSGFHGVSQEIKIDMSNYPNGMYLMQVIWKDGLRTNNKLIKK